MTTEVRKPMRLTGRSLVAAMCIGQLGNLLPHVTVPAIMAPHLMHLWELSAAQAGLMASAFSFGYMLAVPVLTTLTDRVDARLILAAGSALSGLATIAFGIFADGLLSATLIWGVAGMGFAGAYMPGLKALTDRLPVGDTSRNITLYTASFSVGVGLSFLIAQLVAESFGWQAAFYITGTGPLIMLGVCIGLAPCKPPPPHQPPSRFCSGSAKSRSARLHFRIWRSLFRALRDADLDRRILDVRDGAKRRRGSTRSSFRERHRHAVVATGKHLWQRSRAALWPSLYHNDCHGFLCGGGIEYWAQCYFVSIDLAPARSAVRPYGFCRFWRANLWHKRQRRADASRCHIGPPFDRRFWSFSTSVPVPTFVSLCSTLANERRNQRDTSNYLILVWLWI